METRISLLKMMELLHLVEKNDQFYFSKSLAALVANLKLDNRLDQDLAYYIENDMIDYLGDGIYIFNIYSLCPLNAQELLVHELRPNEINYLSFELILNEYGIISQIPTVLTVATTGTSQRYDSKWFSIEFTHVDHSYSEIIENCIFSKTRGILEASPNFALKDLMTINRNIHMIQEKEIAEANLLYEDRQNKQKKEFRV